MLSPMICQKIQTQLPLVGLGAELAENQNPQLNQQPQEETSPTLEAARKYHREWSARNKERIRQYAANYKTKFAEKILETRSSEEYKKKMRDYQREYRSKFPERFKESLRKTYLKYREQRLAGKKSPQAVARRKELYQLRKREICAAACAKMKTPKYKERINRRIRERRRTDIQFVLKDRMRATTNRAFRRNWIRKQATTEALVGCSIAELKAHIESQFVNGMSWDNRKSFVIDHIVPVAAFNLTDSEEASIAFNWKNLQPISWHSNAAKSDSVIFPLPDFIPAHIKERIDERQKPPQ